MEKKNHNVSVIIPVYKDWKSLSDCLISCDQYIDDRHEIWVVNDGSPEDGIEEKILNFLRGKTKFKYHKNKQNLGFVKTCNSALGIVSKANDILLLNSDTVVTEGFLEEMLACLYASERHGVCCPRSNNATILSIPLLFNGSRTDDTYSDTSFSVWKNIKDKLPKYHVIPTGVGFCMLIKRQMIVNFGLFDEIYLTGYNEENDFCSRINRFGYSVVSANHAYVFHLETKSFSKKQKIILEKRNREILNTRYPEYQNAVSYYLDWDMPSFERFADLLGGAYQKKRVLFDLTRFISIQNGTSEHVLSLLEALYPSASKKYDFFIAVNSVADKYFSISERFNNVIVTDRYELPFRFDCIYVPYQIFEYENLFMLNRFGVKYIVDILDIISVRSNYLRNKDLKPIFKTTLEYANGILFNTETVWKDIKDFFLINKKDNQLVAPMHISKSLYQDDGIGISPQDTDVVSRLPKEYLLIIGNTYHHKVLVETLTFIKTNQNIIVFGGNTQMSQHFSSRKNIIFIENGNLSDYIVHFLYKNCKTIIYPSQYEGFGLPVLSAVLYKKPIILFNSPTNKEVTYQYKDKAPFLFFDHFSEIDSLIIEAKQNSLIYKSVQSIKLERKWEVVAEETVAFIQQVIDTPVDMKALEYRNYHIGQLELMYKTSSFNNPKNKRSVFAQTVLDLPKAFNIIKKQGIIEAIRRLYWYLLGVRVPQKSTR